MRGERSLARAANALKRLWGPGGVTNPWPAWLAYDPGLVPPLAMMRKEGIDVMEEWFRWAEEWSMLLRVYGRITTGSDVLEIGCGRGRIAFRLRQMLSEGTYVGFDIQREAIAFLQARFQPAFPRFQFHLADVRNTFYNPAGALATTDYRVPSENASRDIVFAASVLTHMLPENTAHYFHEAVRVLRPGGRFVFSAFLLDHYRAGRPRPLGFAQHDFDFDHAHGGHGRDFAISFPNDPERMTAYSLGMLQRFAAEAGLELHDAPVPGLWSGAFDAPVGAQDLIVLHMPGGPARA